MEIRDILEENINAGRRGNASFADVNSSLCDPTFGHNEPKYALFSYVPNTIQRRKHREFIDALLAKNKIDEATAGALAKLFCDGVDTFPGVGRIRGSFHDVESAVRRAEHIVQNVDPHTSVMVCAVGVPFPLVETGYAASTRLVDHDVDAVLKDELAVKQLEREKAAREMKQREQKLVEESANPHKTPLDRYIELRVKYAQVQHTIDEMKKKFSEYTAIVSRTVDEIRRADAEMPELSTLYFAAYMDACKEVGVTPPDGFLALLKKVF